MPDKSRCSRRQSAIPHTSHPLLPDPFPDQLQARPTTLSLLSGLDGIDRGECHTETSGGDARSHGFDKYRPREGGEESEDTGVGGRITKSGEGTLKSKSYISLASKSKRLGRKVPRKNLQCSSQASVISLEAPVSVQRHRRTL